MCTFWISTLRSVQYKFDSKWLTLEERQVPIQVRLTGGW